jgi:hypothetical protein
MQEMAFQGFKFQKPQPPLPNHDQARSAPDSKINGFHLNTTNTHFVVNIHSN